MQEHRDKLTPRNDAKVMGLIQVAGSRAGEHKSRIMALKELGEKISEAERKLLLSQPPVGATHDANARMRVPSK
jgi:hypothetical protein